MVNTMNKFILPIILALFASALQSKNDCKKSVCQFLYLGCVYSSFLQNLVQKGFPVPQIKSKMQCIDFTADCHLQCYFAPFSTISLNIA